MGSSRSNKRHHPVDPSIRSSRLGLPFDPTIVVSDPPFLLRQMEVTEAATADELAKVKPRYYDTETEEWRTDDRINGQFFDPVDATVAVGDFVTAWWSGQRNAWVLVASGPSSVGVGQSVEAILIGETGEVEIRFWDDDVFTQQLDSDGVGVTKTMRNTSGVNIEAMKKVSWQFNTLSDQYLCAPLEC